MKLKDNKFLKDIHNADLATAPSNKPKNSLISPSIVSGISANAYSNPTGITASGKPISLYTYQPSASGAMCPSGQMQPTGWSNHFLIAKAYEQNPEIFAVDGQYMISAFGGIPGNSAK